MSPVGGWHLKNVGRMSVCGARRKLARGDGGGLHVTTPHGGKEARSGKPHASR